MNHQSQLHDTIQNTCKNALDYIRSQQQNGSFSEITTFYTGLIISILEKFDDPISVSIKQEGLVFILQQKNINWSFNYHQRTIPEQNYPDDLDDTFVSLKAIHECSPDLISEESWESIIRLLTENEIAPGGPYETWVVPPDQRNDTWHDIDIVVNSNILSFLSRFNIMLTPVEEYIDAKIESGKLSSKYYNEEYIIIYFLSKWYTGKHAKLLRKKLLQDRVNGHWDTPLATAFSVTSLLQLGQDPRIMTPAIQYLLDSENNGRWQTNPLFIERKSSAQTIYSSCSAYVSACCLEALSLYIEKMDSTKDSKKHTELEGIFIDTVTEVCTNTFIFSSPLIQHQFDQSLKSLTIKDPRSEIVLLSYNFFHSLLPIYRDRISISLQTLAAANTLGWIGYSIMDNVLDGEDMIALLPFGTKCIRESYELFLSVCPNEYIDIIQSIFDDIESIVAWEHIETKVGQYPEYGSYECLAKKSLGHAIGPIILCLHAQEYAQAMVVKNFFTHYLIARQLNDDAHDWLPDLRNGFLNSVSVGMVKKCSEKDEEALQKLFWEEHIDIVSATIFEHVEKARIVLEQITIVSDTAYLEMLLLPLEQSAHQAISERNKTMKFLELIAEK